jgi:hypothetical protein
MNVEALQRKRDEAKALYPHIGPLLSDVDYVLQMDKKLDEVIALLRESRSRLLLDPDRLEIQEEEASAEVFAAMSEVADCKMREAEAQRDLDRTEDTVYTELVTPKPGALPMKTAYVTDAKKKASCDPRVDAAHSKLLKVQKERRLAEAYCKAIEEKLTLTPGCQGHRNRSS